MAQYVDSQTKAFTAAGTISQYQRVVLGSGGTITAAVLADKEIGIAQNAGVSGEVINVRLRTAQGTHKAIAAASIAAGANVFSAAAGKVSVSATGAFNLGVALEAATANNDIIEIMYYTPGAVV
jgi:hypothetical protein